MRSIHIFNPDSDYALGYAGRNYSPPASIVQLRKKGALFPATYASHGDIIFVLDMFNADELTNSEFYELTKRKGIDIINVNLGLEMFFENLQNSPEPIHLQILPWGWNLSLRNQLIKKGTPLSLLKSEEEIEKIRTLAHRKTTIPFQLALARLLPQINIRIPKEFSHEKEALHFASENPGAYFKMPWSSSGRGVVCRKNMTDLKFSEWIHGAINKQGSVLCEFGYDRSLDFATEWTCYNNEVTFMGLSLFKTSSNGTYIGNRSVSQEEIYNCIKAKSDLWGMYVIEAQKEVLGKLIAPYYNGPLGIDMLADYEGNINPCVEINLRMTMGMATILRNP